MMSMIIPWVLWNVGLLMAVFAINPNNPRFLGYLLRPLGWPAYPVRILLDLITHLEMFYMMVLYWIVFFVVFTAITNHWIQVIR